MPSVFRTPFEIDWKCFGKHSIKSQECSICDIEGPCIEEQGFDKSIKKLIKDVGGTAP
jgi:hypothetical protein